MDQVMELLQRLAPDEIAVVEQRYDVLSAIALKGPIGRRALSSMVDAPERGVRHQCEVLRDQGLIDTAQEGMRITEDGQRVLVSLGPMMRSLTGTDRIAVQLARMLRIEHVEIQPGDSREELRKQELCHRAAQYVYRLIPGARTLAVMGGSTMAMVAQQMPQGQYGRLTVLPARGGMGERVETQANSVAALIAGRLGGQYRMLHLPDDLSSETMLELMRRPAVSEVVDMIRHPDILLYSVGRADVLMQRRGIPAETKQMLNAKGAVAEALGMYFNMEGHSLLSASSVGLDLPSVAAVPRTIAVAGGADKAEAILAAVRATHPSALFIDEAAAQTMMELVTSGRA